MHVLLVEPDVILRKLYAESLSSTGCKVAQAATAQAAVLVADTQKPDVVVVNLDMARHNGVEFLYEFTSYSEWRDVPVIALVSSLNYDLAHSVVMGEQLHVKQVLVQSQTSLEELRKVVLAVGQAREPA
jgi:DNA-binding response OmpR family regulator